MEAIHYGAIPVYVSDDFVFPYNHIFHGLATTMENNVYEYIHGHSIPQVLSMLQDGLNTFRHLYTYEGCRQKILEEVNK